VNDWGKGPASDVLTALNNAVSEGWADTSKLLITGGSYAGYLTAWIIAHDKRFKAACSQRGVYDLKTFFGEGNAWRLVPRYFGGYPWEPHVKEVLERESPINYVQK
jgi:dipeptidyl aminopeptidase/acylaminoacyl peptidase